MFPVALLFIAAVAVHVEEVELLSPENAQQLTSAIEDAIRARTGFEVRRAPKETPLCSSDDEPRCVEGVRRSTNVASVVLLKLFGGSTKIRVVAERFEPTGADPTRRVELSVELAAPFSESAQEAAAGLYPELDIRAPVDRGGRGTKKSATTILPWALVGASAVAVVGGSILYATSLHYDDRADATRMPSAFDVNITSDPHRSPVGLVIGAVGLAGIIAGVVWLLRD